MNTVTRILLREGAETPNAVLTREIEEAGFFGSFMNDREGMEYGFWVFTYDDFEPLKSDGFDRWL
ncbi:hypothetical protein AXK59_01170 [Tsukamurella tyrosinosolvens]|nr:hypothetical protein AXK59_01170 [Tsukamurella tyrosinosolvens]